MEESKKKNRTSQKAVRKYMENHYDRIEINVQKGNKEIIKAHAARYQDEVGKMKTIGYSPKGSVNAFINRAIREAMERDKARAVNKDGE